jgi:GNAT superfamily N-acetyltransferase
METAIIQRGLPNPFRRQAAELYYDAFRQKFEPIFRAQNQGLAILEKAFNSDLAFVAVHQNRLLGLAGMQFGGFHFVHFKISWFIEDFGWLRGPIKFALFLLFDRPHREGQLLMDGIVVHPSMRGRGIGTQLLQSVFDFAHTHGFKSLRLDVVDTNPGARRLYERMGFTPLKTHNYTFLSKIMGFSASTIMIRQIT